MNQTTSQRYRVKPIRERRREWPFPLNLYQTAVGRKWVMAATGIGLLGNLSFPIMTQANLIDEDERLCQVNDLNSNEEVLACLTKQLEDH